MEVYTIPGISEVHYLYITTAIQERIKMTTKTTNNSTINSWQNVRMVQQLCTNNQT